MQENTILRFLMKSRAAKLTVSATVAAMFLTASQANAAPKTVEAPASLIAQEGAAIVEVNGNFYETTADCEDPLENYAKARKIYRKESLQAVGKAQLGWGLISDEKLIKNWEKANREYTQKFDAATNEVPVSCWSEKVLPDPNAKPGLFTQVIEAVPNIIAETKSSFGGKTA